MKITTNGENTIITCETIQISIPSAELFRHFNWALLGNILESALIRAGHTHAKANELASNDEFFERWVEAIAQDETINACLSQLASECVHADETKDLESLPMFKAGDTATYIHSKTGHPLTELELVARSGKIVTILRELTENECDIADVGPMYKAQFMDGYVADVFEDELSWQTSSEDPSFNQGTHYLPVYREGIPKLIRFSDISKDDEVILKLGNNKTVNCGTNATFNGGSWFFRDKNFCPYFPEDFPLCKNYAANTPSVNYPDSVDKVNRILEHSDKDHAAAELRKNGFSVTLLGSLGFAFLWENRIINGFNEVAEDSDTKLVPHEFAKNLAQYNGGAVNGPQLRELCSYFTVMADVASLLSPDFRVFFRNAVIPKLRSEGMRLCLEAKTIDCISGLAANPSPLQDHANGAKELLIDLHDHDLLYTRHAAEDGPTVESSLNTADKALANFIRHGKDHPVCLFTNNPYLANHLTEEVAPKCICFGFNKDNELFIHLSSIPKLAALCWPQEGGSSE